MNRLLIVGPPGAGKGTQGARVAEKLSIPAISTGDIFRKNVAEQTPLGKQVKGIMDSGGYVPDELTNDLVKDRLGEPDTDHGFLLDGYPRTQAQVVALDGMLSAQGQKLDAVLQLDVDTDVLVERLLSRARKENRTDDTEDVIRNRMKVYFDQTEPLIATYAERGLVVTVDGTGDMDDVTTRLTDALRARVSN